MPWWGGQPRSRGPASRSASSASRHGQRIGHSIGPDVGRQIDVMSLRVRHLGCRLDGRAGRGAEDHRSGKKERPRWHSRFPFCARQDRWRSASRRPAKPAGHARCERRGDLQGWGRSVSGKSGAESAGSSRFHHGVGRGEVQPAPGFGIATPRHRAKRRTAPHPRLSRLLRPPSLAPKWDDRARRIRPDDIMPGASLELHPCCDLWKS